MILSEFRQFARAIDIGAKMSYRRSEIMRITGQSKRRVAEAANNGYLVPCGESTERFITYTAESCEEWRRAGYPTRPER